MDTQIEGAEQWCSSAGSLDWDGSFSTLPECDELVGELVRSGLLRRLLKGLVDNPTLLAQCEQLQGIKKLVLIDDLKRDIRLRLHLFKDYAFDVAHNHKWSFHSTILKGSYIHSLHGEVNANTRTEDIERMPVVTATKCSAGGSYFLRHNMVHSLRAEPEAITLVVRGPVAREQSLWTDFKSKNKWTHLGDETDTLKRPLTLNEVKEAVHEATGSLRSIEKEWKY